MTTVQTLPCTEVHPYGKLVNVELPGLTVSLTIERAGKSNWHAVTGQLMPGGSLVTLSSPLSLPDRSMSSVSFEKRAVTD